MSQDQLEHLRDLLAAYMAKKGLRSTEQRRLIVETFFHAPSHITIEELLHQVRTADPRVGYATVYRTLRLLAESGVASERQFGDGLTRYELADSEAHHDHLICTECRAVTEFEDPRIEVIEKEVARRHGFDLRSHKHELYGVCAQCQKRRSRRN
jgi:Fur family transcriptional regulator, ferric uptake regulator